MPKPKLIETPELLLELFKQYQQYTKDNPVFKQDFVGKDATEVHRQLERPLTWVGFECYLLDREIIGDLGDYEKDKDGRYTEYAPIISYIKKFIEHDQFTGATVGIYSHHIIARKLGLVDKQQNDINAEVSGSITQTQFDVLLNAVRAASGQSE